jgi:hypothetical protein
MTSRWLELRVELQAKTEDKMQVNPRKETSTDEVQMK